MSGFRENRRQQDTGQSSSSRGTSRLDQFRAQDTGQSSSPRGTSHLDQLRARDNRYQAGVEIARKMEQDGGLDVRDLIDEAKQHWAGDPTSTEHRLLDGMSSFDWGAEPPKPIWAPEQKKTNITSYPGLSILPGESSREVIASESARPDNDSGSSSSFTRKDREPAGVSLQQR